jgi:hypothetical protein
MDFEKYGIDNFKFDYVALGPEYFFPDKSEQALAYHKSQWKGEFYE